MDPRRGLLTRSRACIHSGWRTHTSVRYLITTNYRDTHTHTRIPHPELRTLLPSLTAYETSTQMARFSQTSYSCQICLTSLKGARCCLLSCSHVFCRACLDDFWKLCIKEGDVGRVGCPEPACVKEEREANEEEVRRVVTDDDVRRWKWLREKRMLERGQRICSVL